MPKYKRTKNEEDAFMTKKMKKISLPLILLMVLAVCLPLASCGSASTPTSAGSDATPAAPQTEGSPVYGGEITLLIDTMRNYFDPAIDEKYGMWLESLWAIDWGLNDPEEFSFGGDYLNWRFLSGQIATDDPIDLDGLLATGDLTVKIRDDVYFQNKDAEYDLFGGRKVTAEDVKYSYDRLLGTGSGFDKPFRDDLDWQRLLDMIESIDAPDENTVVFHFLDGRNTESDLDLFVRRTVNITGKEWDTLTEEQRNDWHWAVGTGPYILTDYAADSFYEFSKNSDYYDFDERNPDNKLPYIDKVTLVSITDTSTIMTQFISGSLDWFSNSIAFLSGSELQQLRDSAKDYTELRFNSVPALTIAIKCSQEPFKDIRVRKAMQMAIDLESINRDYYGYTDEIVIPGAWNPTLADWISWPNWSDETKAGYTYDPDGAKSLLEEAGYPDGFSFECLVDAMSDMNVYLAAQANLAAVGIDMQLSAVSNMMEAMDAAGDKDDPRLVSGIAGQFNEAAMGKMLVDPTGPRYSIFEEDAAVNEEANELMDNVLTATSFEEQSAAARTADEFVAAQHWWTLISGSLQSEDFWSPKVNGYTQEAMLTNKNIRTMAPRLWVTP